MTLRNALAAIGAFALLAAVLAFTRPPESVPAPVSTTATTTPIAPVVPEQATTTALVASSSPSSPDASEKLLAAAPAAAPQVVTPENLTAVGGTLLHAVVNIICIPRAHTGLNGISGSGIVIDSRGLIITAAHVAQYFLLQDYPKPGSMTCTIRTGSPAQDAYTAAIAYLSPQWIRDNADTIIESAPRGTGENDFAILAITGSATSAPLPASFTAMPLSTAEPAAGENTAIGAYAAQFLGSNQIQNDLYPTVVFHTITDLLTFDTDTIDAISVAGTPAAQEGSSGGGVVDASGHVVGIITTSTTKGDASQRTLHAITPYHIRSSFTADTGENLDAYLAGAAPAMLIADFRSQAATLRQVLVSTLQNQ